MPADHTTRVPFSLRAIVITTLVSLAAFSPAIAQTIGMVADNLTGSVTIFDADTDTVLGTVFLPNPGPTVGDCSLALDRGLGFVTDFDYHLWVIDIPSLSLAGGVNPIVVSNMSEDTSLSPDGKFLVACDGALVQPISVVDLDTRTEVDSYSLGHDCNSVEVCDDSSVLVTSLNRKTVRRLTLDDNGQLSDTGESTTLWGQPNNVVCAPGSTSAVVMSRKYTILNSSLLPGLVLADQRLATGRFGVSAAISPTGDKLYVRSNERGWVNAFQFDPDTGALGATPDLTIPIFETPPFFGIDQLAVHPEGEKIYVSQPGSLNVYDATSGILLDTITAPGIQSPTGVCLATGGVSAAPDVVIDVKPGSEVNSINPRSNGVIPVAILTTSKADGDISDFDAWTADPSTLALGPDNGGLKHSSGHAEDVDGDGDIDMMLHFKTQETGIACGDSEVTLTGATLDGVEFTATDRIQATGCTSRKWSLQ
jgi:DNA-binding beta-propeller fold protein YncE